MNTAERKERLRKLRISVRVLLRRGVAHDRTGLQVRLAEHYGVSRQRVSQVVKEEREHDEMVQQVEAKKEAEAATS